MRFLVDEDMPRSLSDLLRRYGHEPVDEHEVRDILNKNDVKCPCECKEKKKK